MPPQRRRSRPGVLGVVALATDTVDDLVLATVRDVHAAVAVRAHALTGGVSATAAASVRAHAGVASVVYCGLEAGLRATSRGLRAADRRGIGARVEDSGRGRVVVSAVNGLLGDRLAEHGSALAIGLAVRREGRDVPLEPDALAEAFPGATGDVVVFLHGLGESEDGWSRQVAGSRASYGSRLAEETTWTPVYLRANTGLRVAENGAALASLLDRLVAGWPTPVRRVALVGHSMGGLVMRAACAVTTDAGPGWTSLVTDVVTLGTPHLGAPLERGVAAGARALGHLPESAPFGRVLEYRSLGILDLRAGLARDVANLPRARYRLVAATLAGSRRHPLSQALGDLLVGYPSATGHPRRGPEMFPGADVLHVRGDHFSLRNHPEVYRALRGWLA
ncbi:MAG TPA: alpha/beta fold hydrolase [Nocardioidaceae bacterium]|nr:alpha/beta fold hydrolase [Nocardioidaceae bacterium]